MKKIIVSLLAVVTVIGAVAVGTRAYFSDTETSVDNTFTAGTIDISVDGENPWTSSYTESMGDFKPGGHEREYSYTIKNVGNNPVNIWKRVVITDQNTGVETEPECDDQNGVWANPDGLCDWAGTADNNVMAPYMHYAMDVAGSPLIDMDWDVRMSEMDAVWTPLQSLEPGDSVVIRQVYTLDETAGNEFQGDEIVFDIELYGEQLMAPGPTSDAKAVVLENKSGDPHWTPVMDNIWGLLTWDDSGNYRVS